MGLDMYLTKKTYVKNWPHQEPAEKHRVTVHQGDKLRKDINPERIKYVIEEVAYWRKANHIHNWFVQYVQDGNDDCCEYDVSREQLQELVDFCKKVRDASKLVEGKVNNGYTFEKVGGKIVRKDIVINGKVIEDPTVAQDLLPTRAGFFFGSTDYDEYYMQDIEATINQLEPLLKEKDCDFIYQSSW